MSIFHFYYCDCSCWHPRHHPRSPSESRAGHLFFASHRALPFPSLCSGPIDSGALDPAPALALWIRPVWAWSLPASSGNRSQQNGPARGPGEAGDSKGSCYTAGHSRVSSHGTEYRGAHSSPERAVRWLPPRRGQWGKQTHKVVATLPLAELSIM